MTTKTTWLKIKRTIESWYLGDYIRQTSIVVIGVLITFWGSDLITKNSRQKEVKATMRLVAEELEHNRQELRYTRYLLDKDKRMCLLLMEHNMDVETIPADTLWKYSTLFSTVADYAYRTDALDVLKGSSLMQYISDKRMLQDVLQIYFELSRRQSDINEYFVTKKNVLVNISITRDMTRVYDADDTVRDQALFLMQHKNAINFFTMVPTFLYWEEFDKLDEMLGKQIQVLKDQYN